MRKNNFALNACPTFIKIDMKVWTPLRIFAYIKIYYNIFALNN